MTTPLKGERERLNLTQQEVADKINVGKATYIRWESGKAIPSDKLAELAGLGFDIGYVVTGKRGSPKNTGVSTEDLEKAITTFLFNTGELGLLTKSDSVEVEALVKMAMFTIAKVSNSELDDIKNEPSDQSNAS
ncbi:XRE family transcriptional regulator [Pseudoalteromonas rubra]|uniref:XRE family transcriptional regulator n=1 Tax=Pseudoalteromonas rubra TaxID=43658 RepID=A0A5S3WJT5_9GAMM|nr:helix-turn-helix transcriptional regulator [Pseudoalteromonas rubra]TMP27183.1 XRE family transcriptional regulator [Pseudoalteromonas rubra]TMP29479.1 XRE family transcriptional regulator [Pseudoalteromonas rubra]